MKNILIISNSGDIHTDLLIDAGQRNGFNCFRYNTDHFRLRGMLTWGFDDKTFPDLKIDNWQSEANGYDLIIYRRPQSAHSRRLDIDQWIGNLLDREWDFIEKAFSFRTKKVVNSLSSLIFANNKINQIRVAQKIGFNVPETIISSNNQELQKFIQNYSCITKAVAFCNDITSNTVRTGKTRTINSSELNDFDSTGYPTLLQRKINPVAIWRIITVGKKSFGFRLHGNELYDEIDSRRVEENLKGEYKTLPYNFRKKIQKMHKNFGIHYASSDFIEDESGKIWFLDLNPEGQWGSYEEKFDTKISDEIVRL